MIMQLEERLARALSQNVKLTVHYFSALPTSSEPLYVLPKGTPAESTEVESHFMSVSIDTELDVVQAFAIEVLAYTTVNTTNLFVSKADSTGYLHLLNVPKGSVSPIRTAIREFLLFLVESKQNLSRRLILSLFARAQDQYLFPGSIENKKKHVLDDRGLIKWWTRILDQTLKTEGTFKKSDSMVCVRANIVVPGCDKHETMTFIPRGPDNQRSSLWQIGDPLRSLGKPEGCPERCLIPRFPDDPKARFAIDLDDELHEKTAETECDQQNLADSDRWRSVRSLAQFWELMSFRQECSAGRLVGFLWGIWEPYDLVGKPNQYSLNDVGKDCVSDRFPPGDGLQQAKEKELPSHEISGNALPILPVPQASATLKTELEVAPLVQDPIVNSETGEPVSDPPPVEVADPSNAPPLIKRTPAEITLAPDAYARCMDILLTLDYCDLPTAVKSTKTFLDAVSKESGKERWGLDVLGSGNTTDLGLFASSSFSEPDRASSNSLAALVRKRAKPEANTLGSSLIRKKPKT